MYTLVALVTTKRKEARQKDLQGNDIALGRATNHVPSARVNRINIPTIHNMKLIKHLALHGHQSSH